MAPPANVGTWPMQASYAAKGDWQGLMKYNKKHAPKPSHHATGEGVQGAKAAPPDDLTQLSGIGPRISSILSDGGVTTYAELEHTDPSELRKIIARRGPAALEPRFVADPGLVRGAGRLAGPRDLQPQVGTAGARPGRTASITEALPSGRVSRVPSSVRPLP